MKAAELLVRCLENEGVDFIFGLPGEENIDVMDALLASRIRFVTTRHEQGAAFMADVYGRLTGKAGVCLSTLGPGATNLITGVADANMDRAPVVAVPAQVGDVPIVIDALGTVVPTQTVAVKSRVPGLLERLHFKEGDLVEQGLVRVQATITENSSKDERIELIERTLRGLRSY